MKDQVKKFNSIVMKSPSQSKEKIPAVIKKYNDPNYFIPVKVPS